MEVSVSCMLISAAMTDLSQLRRAHILLHDMLYKISLHKHYGNET